MFPSLAQQNDSALGGPLSVLVRQKRDHVELDGLLRDLDEADASAQPAVLRSVYRLVFPHAFAEEAVLWPVMRRVLPDGERLTLAVEQEHQEVNELVTTLDRMTPDDPRRRGQLDRLIEVLREDVRDEEDELFPRLQERVGLAQLRLLGVAWEILRLTAPTRAHPVVARRPPGNTLSAVPLSLIDRSRDVLDGTAARASGTPKRLLASASRRLGSVARRVERLPIMRSGEHPSTRTDDTPRRHSLLPLAVAGALALVVIAAGRARR